MPGGCNAERVLTTRELNRAVLARQHLLEPSADSIPTTLAAVGGLRAQYAPSMYVGLWSRMGAFERDALTRALERRLVVQATLMRVTIHLVARRDYWPFALATRDARRELWLRSMRRAASADELEELAERVRDRLTEAGRISRKELDALVGKPNALGVGLWIDLVRVPPAGTWERRRADLFAAAEDWVGAPPDMSAQDAAAQLVRRYLAGFGPAARSDIASYTGLPPRQLAPVYARLRLRTFRSEDGEDLLDVPRAALPDPEQPAPVRYLPTLGRDAARPRPPRPDPPRGAPSEGLPRPQPALRGDVPRRRRRRGDLEAPRWEGRAAAVRSTGSRDTARAARGGRPARGVSRVTRTARSATSVTSCMKRSHATLAAAAAAGIAFAASGGPLPVAPGARHARRGGSPSARLDG